MWVQAFRELRSRVGGSLLVRLVNRTSVYGRRDGLNAADGVLAAFLLIRGVGSPAAFERACIVVVSMGAGAGAARMCVRSDRAKDLR